MTAPQAWILAAIERFEAPLSRYAARLLNDPERARDTVQETFLRLCRESPEKLNGHLSAWLFAVCRSRALDTIKKERRMQPLVESLETACADGELDPARQAIQHEATRQLLALLEGLTEREQEVVRLKFQQGLSYREIATVTEMTVNHVGVVLHTALGKLRDRSSTNHEES